MDQTVVHESLNLSLISSVVFEIHKDSCLCCLPLLFQSFGKLFHNKWEKGRLRGIAIVNGWQNILVFSLHICMRVLKPHMSSQMFVGPTSSLSGLFRFDWCVWTHPCDGHMVDLIEDRTWLVKCWLVDHLQCQVCSGNRFFFLCPIVLCTLPDDCFSWRAC